MIKSGRLIVVENMEAPNSLNISPFWPWSMIIYSLLGIYDNFSVFRNLQQSTRVFQYDCETKVISVTLHSFHFKAAFCSFFLYKKNHVISELNDARFKKCNVLNCKALKWYIFNLHFKHILLSMALQLIFLQSNSIQSNCSEYFFLKFGERIVF